MDEMRARTFMRGEVKNAKAEELLALIKAEREVKDIEENEVPNTLRKRPLLPAIKAREESRNGYLRRGDLVPETTLASFAHNIHIKTDSRFIWRDSDLDEDMNSRLQIRKSTRSKEFLATSRELSLNDNHGMQIEIPPKNLPPLRTKRLGSDEFERPTCPEPRLTPPFGVNSHET